MTNQKGTHVKTLNRRDFPGAQYPERIIHLVKVTSCAPLLTGKSIS